MPRLLALPLAFLAATAADSPRHYELLPQAVERIAARDPELGRLSPGAREQSRRTEPAAPGWQRLGVDLLGLIAARPGGLDGNFIAARDRDDVALEYHGARVVADIVPPHWSPVVLFGRLDGEPGARDVLFFNRFDAAHVMILRSRAWQQGNASCWGPPRGAALYRIAPGQSDADAMEQELALTLLPDLDLSACELYHPLGRERYRKTRHLPDGRRLIPLLRLEATFSVVAATEFARLIEAEGPGPKPRIVIPAIPPPRERDR